MICELHICIVLNNMALSSYLTVSINKHGYNSLLRSPDILYSHYKILEKRHDVCKGHSK